MWLWRWLYLIILVACLGVLPIHADDVDSENDSEFTKGITCYNANEYKEALQHFARCVELDQITEEHTIHNDYASSWQAHCYYLIGQREKAEEISEFYMVTPVDRSKTSSIDSLYTLATESFDSKDYTSALPLYQKCIKLIRNTFGSIHIFYSGILEEYAFVCESLNLPDESIKIRKELTRIILSYYGITSKEYADALISLSWKESSVGKFNDAIIHADSAVQIYTNLEEVELRHQSLCKISNYQSFLGKYAEACESILIVLNESTATDEPLYLMAMADYADYLLKLGRLSDGINVCNDAIALCKQRGEDNAIYATTLNVKANLEQARGNCHEAIRLGEEALKIRQSIYGEIHPETALILNNLARYYMGLGQYQYCIELQKKVLAIYELYFGRKEENYSTGLNNLADYYDKSGRVDKALQVEKEALTLWEKMYGKNHPDYAMALTIIANYFYKTGNLEQAVQAVQEALTIKEQLFGKNIDYAISLENYAYYNSLLGENKRAIQIELDVLNIFKSSVGTSNPDYSRALITLADYYDRDGDVDSALQCLESAREIYAKTVGTNNPAYAFCISRLAKKYADLKMIDRAEDYSEAATSTYKDIVLDNFRFLASNERQQLWGLYENWFTDMLPNIVQQIPTDRMSTVLYDSELLRKGLLLNAELALRDLLVESNDTLMLKSFDDLYELKQSLQKKQELNQLTAESLDSLNTIIAQKEKKLIEGSRIYGDYTANLSTNWIDVQSVLDTNEIAIEYTRFLDQNNVARYSALVLSPEATHPQYLSLCSEDSLMMIVNEDKRSKEWGIAFYLKLVAPVLSSSNHIKTIYFSPAGIIHNIPLENIVGSIDEYSGNLQLYRLSSTRQLIKKVKDKDKNSASLFGGISYNSGLIEGAGAGDEALFTELDIEPVIRDASILRDGYKDLPGTEIEVRHIDEILTKDSIETVLYVHENASESAFKLMSGKPISILHIATHGFYWTEQYAGYKKSSNVLLPIITNRGLEDMSLTRSGLILAGANRVIRDRIITPGQEDGILTAREISFLDLRKVDLVVLSACQTGLGEISGEGVFGLQRGFKKAGVHTIVMSLWSVDDEATQILMEEFYRNIIKGENQQIALFNAQRFLRSTYSHYSSPYFWAAFVILDSI